MHKLGRRVIYQKVTRIEMMQQKYIPNKKRGTEEKTIGVLLLEKN